MVDPAVMFLAETVMFARVSVCEVDSSPWYELIVRVCVEQVGVNEGCECKSHDE